MYLRLIQRCQCRVVQTLCRGLVNLGDDGAFLHLLSVMDINISKVATQMERQSDLYLALYRTDIIAEIRSVGEVNNGDLNRDDRVVDLLIRIVTTSYQ